MPKLARLATSHDIKIQMFRRNVKQNSNHVPCTTVAETLTLACTVLYSLPLLTLLCFPLFDISKPTLDATSVGSCFLPPRRKFFGPYFTNAKERFTCRSYPGFQEPFAQGGSGFRTHLRRRDVSSK